VFEELDLVEKIHILKRRKGLTLWQIASQMGMSPTALYNRLAGHQNISEEELALLSILLGENLRKGAKYEKKI